MKQNKLSPWILGFLVIFGLLLSYFLFYNMTAFEQLIGVRPTDEIEVINTELADTNQATGALENTQVRTGQVIAPNKLIYRRDGLTKLVKNQAVISTISSLLESRPIEVTSTAMVENEGTVSYLQTIDHLQIVFPESLPLGLYSSILQIEEGEDDNILVDRIYIPLIEEEKNSAFIVDSANNRIIYANLANNLTYEDIIKAIDREDVDFPAVLMYQGQVGPIYLPVDNMTVPTEVFTLEKLPESLYINEIFEEGNFTLSEITNPAGDWVIRYQNYLNTLDMNRSQQRFSLSFNRVEQGDDRTSIEKIRNSLSYLRQYEYWQYDFRIDNYSNNLVNFRRYYQGYPIHSQLQEPDYGNTVVQLRNDLSGDVYRYHQATLILDIHLNNVSQNVELVNHQEIVRIIQNMGYQISQFEDIFVGYEWLPEMENYKKAELFPKWIFKFDGSFYTIDDIQSEEFNRIWQREWGENN